MGLDLPGPLESLAEIPVFKEITQRIIQAIINEAVSQVRS